MYRNSSENHFILTFIIALLITGCVAVKQSELPYDSGSMPIPEGHAALFIAVPGEWPNGKPFDYELSFNDTRVFLEEKSLNRLIVPAGTYSMQLPRVAQDENNTRILHTFENGKTVRLLLIERTVRPEIPDSLSAKALPVDLSNLEMEYLLLPSRLAAFEQMVEDNKLPLVEVKLQH